LEPVPYRKIDEEIVRQYNYLKSLDLSFGWRIHPFWIWFYCCVTVAVIIFHIVTDADTLIVTRVMSLVILALMYVAALIVLIRDAIRRSRHVGKIDRLLKNALDNEISMSIQFTTETITFITDKVKSEIAWTYWNGYREVDGNVFLFIKDGLYNATSFSAAEIGEDNLEALRSIVKGKLPELQEKDLISWYR